MKIAVEIPDNVIDELVDLSNYQHINFNDLLVDLLNNELELKHEADSEQ